MNQRLNGCQQTTLDIIRISAALFVLVGHSFSFYQLSILKDQAFFPYIQNIGVVLFFLLSGFLSAYTLTNKNKNHDYCFKEYFIHKVLRVYKEYLPALFLIAIIDAISIFINGERYAYYQAYNIKQFIGNLLMLHNMGPNSILGKVFIPFGSGRPLWTLAIEWWLYMLFGMCFLHFSNREHISTMKAISFVVVLFMCIEYLITGRGNGLGFVFLLGVFSFYFYDLIDITLAKILFPISIIAYILYGMVFKEAYTVYSFVILELVLVFCLKI